MAPSTPLSNDRPELENLAGLCGVYLPINSFLLHHLRPRDLSSAEWHDNWAMERMTLLEVR